RRQLHCHRHDRDFAIGLVRNLGFVAGRACGSNAAVRLHLDAVSDIALAASFSWLSDCTPARVLIDFVGAPRPAEVCISAGAAIARLVDLTRGREFGRHVAEKSCTLDQLPAKSPLRGLVDLWAN